MWLKTWFGTDRAAIAVELLHHGPHDALLPGHVLQRVADLTGLPLVAAGRMC
jgi:error-prone DNA polymerase